MALTKIGTDGIKDDAVTSDKVANAINSSIAANTAKDLTALSAANLTSGTIPDARFPATLPAASAANLTAVPAANITGTLPAISGANLTSIPAANITGTLPAISGANLTNILPSQSGQSGKFLTTDGSSVSFGDAGGGIEHIYTWHFGGFNLSGSAYITSNWANTTNNWAGYSGLGAGMSESSGVFTFPVTGHWWIQWRNFGYRQHGYNRWVQSRIYATKNNGSSWAQRTTSSINQFSASGIGNAVVYDSIACDLFFDVTSTSTHKVKFWMDSENSYNVSGGDYGAYITFIKLADT